MLRRLLIVWAFLPLFTHELLAQPIGAADRSALHRRAIELVRNENYSEAIPLLRTLHNQELDNLGYRYDLIAALSWAEADTEALALAEELELAASPLYVVEAVAKSARNTRAFELAIEWYTQAMAIDPTGLDAIVGLAMSLAESGRYRESDALFASLSPETQREPAVLAARAYTERLVGRLIESLTAYDQILQNSPDDREALRGKALVLRDLLLPRQALRIANQNPGILNAEEIQRLEVDALAIQLRLAAKTVYPLQSEGLALDRTIAQIEDRLDQLDASSALTALKFDRIAALAERNMAAQAILEYESLAIPVAEIPPYVLTSAGKAYLQIEQPARALELLERAAATPPVDVNTLLALVFAYLDLDRYEDAIATVEVAIINEPLLLRASGDRVVAGNERRVQAEIAAAIADTSIDDLDAAQKRLQSLLDNAPNNTDLRHELGNIYRFRGWLDAALFEYNQVITMDDQLVYARVGRAHTLIDAQRYHDAENTLTALTSTGTTEPIVQRLEQRWDIHNKSLLQMFASQGDSDGTTFGSENYSLDTYWYTHPVRYRFRGFVHLHDSTAEFPEGESKRRRVGIGTEYRTYRWTASGALERDRRNGDTGVTGTVDWRFSDYWRLSGRVSTNAQDTPLRAYRASVNSDFLSASATFARSESRSFTFGTLVQTFSDNNSQKVWYGNMDRRLLTRPRSLTTFVAEVSTASNSRSQVAYFAPTSDVALLVGARHEWRLRRRFDRQLTQQAELRLGEYQQSGFSGGTIWRANYGLRMRFSEALQIEGSVQRARNIYDGIPETSTNFILSVEARL